MTKSSIPGAYRLVNSRVFFQQGCEPARIVIDYHPGSYQPISTHVECVPEDRPPFCYSGHYFFELEEAVQDFGVRFRHEFGKALADDLAQEAVA